jgi:50S ribosomal subunit-associated GTPase HflX
VVDISSRKHFHSAIHELEKVMALRAIKMRTKNIPILLLLNKTDLVGDLCESHQNEIKRTISNTGLKHQNIHIQACEATNKLDGRLFDGFTWIADQIK